MAAPPPSRKQILSLFGSFLRSSRQFTDYNIREYTKRPYNRRILPQITLTNPSSVATAFSDGNYQRQVRCLQSAENIPVHICRRRDDGGSGRWCGTVVDVDGGWWRWMVVVVDDGGGRWK
ncbi:uncharacterized protein LOC118490515 [Helianthus annuus]|uniref:uncharacterized protein LOC118490515 n=1 Tax=Helianthus annuus TaxID=4232 RepID=UPI001652EC80|nr:uncharacterized protein LOC118490515 [Helianthus annuus]